MDTHASAAVARRAVRGCGGSVALLGRAVADSGGAVARAAHAGAGLEQQRQQRDQHCNKIIIELIFYSDSIPLNQKVKNMYKSYVKMFHFEDMSHCGLLIRYRL